jgi:short repeat uncharacterized protein DUF308
MIAAVAAGASNKLAPVDRRRLREVGATVLLVLGGIGLVVASTGWWLERSFLDTGRFTGTANDLLDQDEVQAELSSVLVEQLSEQAGTDLRAAEPFLAAIVAQVVDSGAFRTVFDTALSNAHRVLVDRGTERIILDLTSAYDQIRGPLQQVAPNLAAELPSRRQLEVVLIHRSELSTVWDVIDEIKRTVDLLTIGAVVLLAAGIALAVRRWQAVARGAWIVVGAGTVLVVALFLARPVINSRISDESLADAVVASFRVITTSLVVQTVIIVVIAALVGFAARFTARHGIPAWQPAARRAWAWFSGALQPEPGEATPVPLPLRIPPPRTETRGIRSARAVALLVVGLLAIIEPASVASALVVIAGVVLLVLSALEAVAAWRAPAHRPSPTSGDGAT